MVAHLLAAGARAEASNLRGWTALMFASQGYSAEAVGALLAAGAPVDASSAEGVTSLLIASASGNARAAAALVAHRAEVERADQASAVSSPSSSPQPVSPTGRAPPPRPSPATQLAPTQAGRRSLMLATKAGSTECVRVLLEAGASVDAAAPDGWRSAMFAEARGDQLGTEVQQYLPGFVFGGVGSCGVIFGC